MNSRGVAILSPINSDITLTNTTKDTDGRILLIDCTVHETKFTVINVYAPTKDKVSLQNEFLENIRVMVENNGDKNIVVGGDFNTCLNPEFDKKGGKFENLSVYGKNLLDFIDNYALTDIWRIRNQNKKQFTRRENTKGGIVQSRLDYWLISSALQSQISNTNIKPAFKSDHSLLTLEIELHETPKRGKGTWKFNNQLLIDKQYVKQIRNTISMINKEVKFDNKNLFWEYLKCQIRTDTMIYAGKKAKEQRQKEKELTQKIEEREHNVTSNKNEHLEYQQLKSEWESIPMNKSNGIIIRSRAKWVEYGEKNSKYFLNLEKRNYNNKCIRKLITADEKEITNPSEILQEQFRFYADLYQTKLKNQSKAAGKNVFLDNTSIPELTQTDKDICDSPLTLTDLTNALKDMADDKSPGVDGFSTNFYKYFWNDLQQPLLDSFLYSFETGMLSDGQRRGLLNLIPKKDKDLRFLKSWRPVALLATDYKILAKALSLKMQKVILSLVHTDQVGYIKGRYIGENIRKIEDIINYTSLKNVPGTLALIDFQKAFDTVEWPCLFQTQTV